MGVIIQAVAVSQDSAVRGSIAHAARAGRDCVSRAGVALQDIGMLINTGVYRDDNLVEPAMAAFAGALEWLPWYFAAVAAGLFLFVRLRYRTSLNGLIRER